MHDVAVIDDPGAAEVSLDPVRARRLAELSEPGSATSLILKYHDESAAGGRAHRIVVAVHPTVQREEKG